MHRNILPGVSVVTIFLIAALLGGCGSGNKEGGQALTPTDLANATHLGDLNCLQCHNAGKDLTMNNDLDTRTIGAVWQNSLHNGDINGIQAVHCEDCHGGGQFHWGLGPLANPVPMANVCLQCHGDNNVSGAPVAGLSDMQSYLGTGHANGNDIPNATFSQIPTPVSSGQHIEECSVCHDSNQRFVFDTNGNLLKPDPNNLPTPQVSCASCHDGHQPGLTANVSPRLDGSTDVDYQILRKVQVNANGANDANAGAWIRPIIFWNHSTMGQTTLVGTVLTPQVGGPLDANGKRELSVEKLCASCHTVGTYKNSGGATHQPDTYPQWQDSGHGNRNNAAWAEFSANPSAYTDPSTGVPYVNAGSHQTTYPVDLSRANSFGNYACFKCHNGMGSIDWQNNVQGTADASVVWGDEPVTCITCHDPHANVVGQSKNTRKPVVMTNYSTTSVKIFGNVFLDTQLVPGTTGNSTVCVFCHQGRESGYTLFKTKLAPGKTITGNFFNPHYLGTAAMLWGANGYEFPGRFYGVNSSHQGANCATCHMNNPTPINQPGGPAGGHTWVRNVNTCNTSSCHGGFGPIPALPGTVFPNISTYRAPFDTNNYSGDNNTQGIAQAVRSLQQKLIAQLQLNGIFYNDLLYPYFFTSAAFTTSFTAWTLPTYKAAFNLSFIIKGLPSEATSQANVPNGSAATHDHVYNIQLLQDSIANLIPGATLNPATNIWSNTGGVIDGAVRPFGSRPATNYLPQPGGGYSPNQ